MIFAYSIPSRASLLPFSEDFNDGVADGFSVAGTAGVYTVVSNSGEHGYHAILSAPSGNATASAGLTMDNAASEAFVISTKVVISSIAAPSTSSVNVGFGLFSNTVDFTASGQYRLVYQLTQGNAGKLQIIRNGTSVALSTAILPARLNVPYMLQAIITHADGEVTIKGLLSDDSNTITVTITDPAPLPGAYFGYRTALNAVGGTASVAVNYDDFSMISAISDTPAGDLTVAGNLFLNGTLDVAGNDITFGSEAGDYGAAFFYGDRQLTVHLTSPDGAWIWKRENSISMTLAEDNVLHLPDSSGESVGILLNPSGYSEFSHSLILWGDDNRSPHQTITDETSLLTVALADARYLQSDGSSSPTVPALTVTGNAHFEGAVHIEPQGDLSMGEFTDEPVSP